MELVIILIFLTFVYLYLKSVKPKRFPPGPPKLPYLGGIPFVFQDKSLMQTLRKLVDNYGPLSGVYFGEKPMIVISDYEMLKNLFKKEELSYRPPIIPNNRLRPGWEYLKGENEGQSPGVIMTNGQVWREQRRFLLKNLRDFGFGRNSMESIIQEEMAKVCSKLSKIPQNEATDLNRTMNISVLNALWNIMVGERLELDDPKSSRFITMFDNFFREGGPNTLAQTLLPHPLMMTWPILRDITGYSRAAEVFGNVADFVQGYVDDHKKTMDPDNARDFTDLMLMEIQNTTDKNSSFYGKMGEYLLISDLVDMFLAGMETTSSSLMWTFLYLLHNPDVQKKVHLELDTVVGRNRFPSLDDRSKLHYTNAVLLESLRIAVLVGPGVPHYAASDVEVGDFVIPKGSTVFGSLFHIMNDPNHFKDPQKFHPERFLNSMGEFVNDERVVPFGIGKRVCLGQTLAEKEFFIFFTGFMQQFELRTPDGHVLPSYHTDVYFAKDILRPPPKFSVNLIHRLS